MNSTTCYSHDQLHQYVLGQLPNEINDQIARHLSDCELCEDTVVGLDQTADSLIELLSSNANSDLVEAEKAALPNELREFQSALQTIRNHAFVAQAELNPTQSSSSHSLADVLPIRIGEYELQQQIATGGMGSVFRARHVRLEKIVAIKILPQRKMQNGLAISRFSREMKIVGQMDHPAMVRATDAGESEGTHFLVMELVDGLDLSKVVRRCGPLTIDDACSAIRQAAIGLQYAHDQGVIHRDIKPSNLMLTRSGDIKILDLGLATLGGLHGAVDELTTVGQLMGTLDYMAPEQCGGQQEIDGRTDIYGLGATLYKLLTGLAPYSHPTANTPLKKLKAMATEAPTPIQSRRPELPDSIARIIEKCLARDPENRFATAAELAAVLEPFASARCLAERLKLAEQVSDSTETLVAENLNEQPSDAKLSIGNQQLATKRLLATPGSAKSLHQKSSGWFSGWVTTACLLGLLGLAGWGGIMIYLDTIGGQLIIESEVDDISVSVVADERPLKELAIEHGANATKLRAGKYRIEIKGASDALVIQNDQFELRNGATVLAKITKKLPDLAVARESSTGESRREKSANDRFTPTKASDTKRQSMTISTEKQPLYEGAPLFGWVDQLLLESLGNGGSNRKNQKTIKINSAIKALVPRYSDAQLNEIVVDGLASYQNEVSIDAQLAVIRALLPLCRNEATTQQVLDRALQFNHPRLLAPFTENHFQQIQDELLERFPKADVSTKAAYMHWLLGEGFAHPKYQVHNRGHGWNEQLPKVSDQWLTNLLNDKQGWQDESLAMICCETLAVGWLSDGKSNDQVIAKFMEQASNSQHESIQDFTLSVLSQCSPPPAGLLPLLVTSIEKGKRPPRELVRLLENPQTLEAIKKYLSDSKKGIPVPIEEQANHQNGNGLGGMGMGMGMGGSMGMGDDMGMGGMNAGMEMGMGLNNETNGPGRHPRADLVAELGNPQLPLRDERLQLIQTELKQSDNPTVLDAAWNSYAALTNTTVPLLFEGRTYEQWAKKISQPELSTEELTRALRALANFKISPRTFANASELAAATPRLKPSLINDIAKHFRQSKFESLEPKTELETNLAQFFQRRRFEFVDALDYINDEDAMFTIYLLANLGFSIRSSADIDAIAKAKRYARRFIGAESPLNRRALYVAAPTSHEMRDERFGTTDFLKEFYQSKEILLEVKLAFLKHLDSEVSWNWSENPAVSAFSDITDPRDVVTVLTLAHEKNQQTCISNFVVDQLISQPDYLHEIHAPIELDLWNGPISETTPAAKSATTVFMHLVFTLDAMGEKSLLKLKPKPPANDGEETASIYEQRKQKLVDVLTTNYQTSDGATRRVLERILRVISPESLE